MRTSTDWFVFGAIVVSFAGLIVITSYLIYVNNTLRIKTERLEFDLTAQKNLNTQQREYIEKRDKEFRIPNHELTQVIKTVVSDEVEKYPEAADDPFIQHLQNIGRHHKNDGE